MNWPLIVGMILIISTAPLFAQNQPDFAKLKADAQKVVSTISGDQAKTQTYCQADSLSGEIALAAQAKDEQKAEALTKKKIELEQQLGPEYGALFEALSNADPESIEYKDIISVFDPLDTSCPH